MDVKVHSGPGSPPEVYASVQTRIFEKGTRAPYGRSAEYIRERLKDIYALVELHEESAQHLTVDDKLYLTELRCWEELFRYGHEVFPGRKPDNPARTLLPSCDACWWLETPRLQCPFVRIVSCRTPRHRDYSVDFAARDEECPQCQREEAEKKRKHRAEMEQLRAWSTIVRARAWTAADHLRWGAMQMVGGSRNGNPSPPITERERSTTRGQFARRWLEAADLEQLSAEDWDVLGEDSDEETQHAVNAARHR